MPLGRAASTLIVLVTFGLAPSACRRADATDAARKRRAHEELVLLKERLERRLAEEREKRGAKSSLPPRLAPSEATPSAAAPVVSASPKGISAVPLENADQPWIVDRAVDVAAPAPAAATPLGVLMNTRDGELALARLGAVSQSALPVPAKIDPLPDGAGPFALGRGPSVAGDFAYWISHGTLVRRRVSPRGKAGPLEILAKDAFDGTRVGVPLPAPGKKLAKIPAAAAYVVRPEKPDGPLVAKLWLEGQTPLSLTSEGNSTHSVSLVQTSDGLLVLSVQARMAITPVQVRKVTFDAAGNALLGEDVVVWVGGGIQPLTEMTVLPGDKDALYGFIPHERSIAEFGIARLDIGMNPSMDTKTTWKLYANGIDPAPVAAGRLCGESVILYARPETAAPDSEQELVLESVGFSDETRSVRVESAHSFYFVSYSEVQGGALVAWVNADGTRATLVRCRAARSGTARGHG